MSDFLKADNKLSSQTNTDVPQRARVIDNKDPKKLGRVKYSVQSLEEGFPPENSDWAYPTASEKAARAPGSYSFPEIPEIGSEVEISFPYGNKDNPRVTCPTNNELNSVPELFEEDYPDSYGNIDSNSLLFVNKKKKEMTRFFDAMSHIFRIQEDGSVIIYLPKDLLVQIDGNIYLKLDGELGLKVSGDMGVEVGGNRDVKVGSNDGIQAGGFISHQAARVTHNSGTLVGIIDGIVSSVDSGMETVKDAVSKFKKLFAKAKTADENNRERIGKE